MSGQFLIHQNDRPKATHIRAQFTLAKPLRTKELVFNDQRTFGWLSVEETTNNVPTSAQHIAPDPFDPLFDKATTINNYRKRNIKIKTALLNQEIMSGVGNIYADETLWRAKIHPEISTADLTPKKISKSCKKQSKKVALHSTIYISTSMANPDSLNNHSPPMAKKMNPARAVAHPLSA
jgi:formamidopyrimidine-DNA glycosylase